MTIEVSRYVIYLADLNPTRGAEIAKTRPVVVVRHPRWRSRIPVTGVRRKAEIAVDQIRTISRNRLVKRLDELSTVDAARVRRLIVEMYGE